MRTVWWIAQDDERQGVLSVWLCFLWSAEWHRQWKDGMPASAPAAETSSGVAIIVETSTDNRNRTAGNVRAWFNKYGGNLGQNGCVGYLFEEKGVISIVDEDEEIEEDKIMEDALECGAEDIKCDEGEYTIYTDPADLDSVRDAVLALGYKINTADLAKVPTTYVTLDNPDDVENMEKMLDKFNEDDDVNAVYTNWDN